MLCRHWQKSAGLVFVIQGSKAKYKEKYGVQEIFIMSYWGEYFDTTGLFTLYRWPAS